jgi:hypothetical protein
LAKLVADKDERLLNQNHNFKQWSLFKPFFKEFSNAKEVNGWLMFKHPIPNAPLKKLYIRECYRTIASAIHPGENSNLDIKKAIVTGTRGIGKTWFLLYFLWKLVKENKRVLVIYHPDVISFGNLLLQNSGWDPSVRRGTDG